MAAAFIERLYTSGGGNSGEAQRHRWTSRSPGAAMLVALFGITVVGGMSGERVSGETT
ncbi:MAG: hypothetical protein OXU62_06015 [Gammaproteobacteria bacterium]|nr:hypothetical protein [Gammaproteobacteria bacterium]